MGLKEFNQSHLGRTTKLLRSTDKTTQIRFGRRNEPENEINPTNPPTDLPDLEPTFFQGLHENIKLKVIDNLNAGPPANLGQNLRRYNDIVCHATAAEEEQKRVAKTIHQMLKYNT
jgi:hypothetical protein